MEVAGFGVWERLATSLHRERSVSESSMFGSLTSSNVRPRRGGPGVATQRWEIARRQQDAAYLGSLECRMRPFLKHLACGLTVAFLQSASAQSPATVPTEATPSVVPAAQTSPANTPAAEAEPKASSTSTNVDAQLESIKTALGKLGTSASAKDYTPSLMALSGVVLAAIIAAIIAVWTQIKRAKLEIGYAIVQWRLQQLSQLYGPLHALFRESNALYRHMNRVLAKAEPGRFRLRNDASTDRADGLVFEIETDGSWMRFRTVLHLQEVYGKGYGVEEYFHSIAAIGGRIVKVIEEKAGYVLPDQEQLSSLFGLYLAHHSVLERLVSDHKTRRERIKAVSPEAKVSIDELPMPVDESAVFPAEIQQFIDSGFNTINSALRDWQKKAS